MENSIKFHQLECSEEKNTFSFVFETKGLSKPSINYALERMLNAGGSKKYPVRNLMNEMKHKSFNSVEYSSTVTDNYLMFSFCTPIIKDFSNLL